MRGILRIRLHGFTLLELLCVMVIISILASLMLPAMMKALRKARGLADHLGGPGGIQMRIDEVKTNYTRYRAGHPNHGLLTRKAFIHQLQLSEAAEAWLNLKSVDFYPFAASHPLRHPAIVVNPSPGGGSGENLVIYTVEDLILR